jgi:uncharacterized protein (TIRG00374 family)
MRRINLVLLIVGIIFLYLMLKQLGWANLGRHFLHVGYYWPLLLAPYGLVNYLMAASWSNLLPDRATRPSLGPLFLLHLAGESLNQLTPAASIGGEPFKALRLKARGVPWEEAAASVVIQKGILVLSLVLYIFLGLALTAFMLNIGASRLGSLSLAGLVLGVAGVLFLVAQRSGPCLSAMRLLEKCRLCPQKLKEKELELSNLDSCLAGFYRNHPGRALLSFMLLLAGWMLHGVEVWVIFRLLGHPVNFGLALCLDALVTIFASLGFMIPASMGVQDAGAILVSFGLSLGAALGGAFTIMRRIREAFWLSLGLFVIAGTRRRTGLRTESGTQCLSAGEDGV